MTAHEALAFPGQFGRVESLAGAASEQYALQMKQALKESQSEGAQERRRPEAPLRTMPDRSLVGSR